VNTGMNSSLSLRSGTTCIASRGRGSDRHPGNGLIKQITRRLIPAGFRCSARAVMRSTRGALTPIFASLGRPPLGRRLRVAHRFSQHFLQFRFGRRLSRLFLEGYHTGTQVLKLKTTQPTPNPARSSGNPPAGAVFLSDTTRAFEISDSEQNCEGRQNMIAEQPDALADLRHPEMRRPQCVT
jgi:hypothetical protein